MTKSLEEDRAALKLFRGGTLAPLTSLPLTCRVLGAEFDRLLRATIEESAAPQGRRADAQALAARLDRLAASGDASPPWIGDLARFEAAFVEASRGRPRLLLRGFGYPVGAIARALATGEAVGPARRRPCIGLWLRLSAQGRLFHRLA